MKKFLYIFVLLLGLTTVWACEDESATETDVNIELDDWENRNAAFFRDTLNFATRQITAAKTRYGKEWEQHCEWRTYRNYQCADGGTYSWKDSIAVRVITRGTGSGCPLVTDSACVTYAGRLMPSRSYDYGYMFDHSGLGNTVAQVMDTRFEVPASFYVGGLVPGFTTALLKMHIGDYYRVFIPSKLGYGSEGQNSIPGYSTLCFDMRLHKYARKGSNLGFWH